MDRSREPKQSTYVEHMFLFTDPQMRTNLRFVMRLKLTCCFILPETNNNSSLI